MVHGPLQPGHGSSSIRGDIDGLRALSIILVVAYHAGISRFAGGYVGVDVFFVLSGYLITGLLVREQQATGRIALVDFYARRVRRLLPMAGLVLVSTLAMGIALLPPLLRAGLVADVRAAALYVANWRFAAQATAYSDAQVTDTLLLHYWSLSVEEQFYVLWPLLIILAAAIARRRRPELFLPVLASLLTVVVVASLWASIVLSSRLGPAAYYATHTRLWEMGAGAALALVLPRLRAVPRVPAQLLAVVGIVAIIVSALVYDATTAFPGIAALLPVGGTLLVVTSGTHGPTAISRALSAGPLPRLGRWSYAWYLWHWPLIGVAALLDERLGNPWPAGVTTATAVVVSLALAAASHHLVENPLRHARYFRARVHRSLAFGAALTLLPVLAAMSYGVLGDVGDGPTGPPVAVDDDDSSSTVSVASGAASLPMSAADAADDTVTLAHATCNSSIHGFEVDPTCRFGAPASDRTIVLVGDSHAQHWLPALDAAGRDEDWSVLSWTMSACPAMDVPVYEARLETRYRDCEAWRNEVADEIAAREDIDLVVIGRSYGYENLVVDDAGNRVEDRAVVAQLWREGTQRAFDRYTQRGANVLVIRDTPWAPHNVPTCISEHPGDPNRCDFGLDGSARRDTLLFEAEAAVDDPDVRFWDASDTVCPTDPCAAMTADGVVTYRDRHHLTQTYSRRLADQLAAAIEPSLGS